MDLPEIRDLDSLISSYLHNHEKIVSQKTTRLTSIGMNYGSLMVRVEITVKNEQTNKERILDTVAKLIPSNDFIQEVFHTQITFKNEIALYVTVIPELQKFRLENGLEAFTFTAKCYGGRINLNPQSELVDKDAVLLLENLKTSGHTLAERTKGFDLETAKHILKEIAALHSTGLGLKLKKPDVFEKHVKPYLPDFGMKTELFKTLFEQIEEALAENPKTRHLVGKAKDVLPKGSDKSEREPWPTVSHNDLWVNNFMIKNDASNTSVKIVDYQVCEYKSPCRDLLFFLFSSISHKILAKSLDELLDWYYKNFIEELTKLKCDVGPFDRASFDQELKMEAHHNVYFHVCFMLAPIFATAEDLIDIDRMKSEDLLEKKLLSVEFKEQLWYTTLEFERRGWL